MEISTLSLNPPPKVWNINKKNNTAPPKVQKNMVKNGLKQLEMHFKHPSLFFLKKWNGFDPPPLWQFPYFF